jgi:hypothetical protein
MEKGGFALTAATVAKLAASNPELTAQVASAYLGTPKTQVPKTKKKPKPKPRTITPAKQHQVEQGAKAYLEAQKKGKGSETFVYPPHWTRECRQLFIDLVNNP